MFTCRRMQIELPIAGRFLKSPITHAKHHGRDIIFFTSRRLRLASSASLLFPCRRAMFPRAHRGEYPQKFSYAVLFPIDGGASLLFQRAYFDDIRRYCLGWLIQSRRSHLLVMRQFLKVQFSRSRYSRHRRSRLTSSRR